MLINKTFYENRVLYLGDAAHSIHPIAGQGWNLGMRDVKKLFNLAQKYKYLRYHTHFGKYGNTDNIEQLDIDLTTDATPEEIEKLKSKFKTN